ncbi:MAG: hypothetical protein FWF83_04420 [Clostridiales bacterium]|nr:hypothetical protein [Clostridiales bacterium]
MQVKLRFLCADLQIPFDAREIEIDQGATVGQALDAYLRLYPVDDPENLLPKSIFMIGKQAVQLDAVMNESDTLMVMRLMNGG